MLLVTFKGELVKLYGKSLSVGESAPSVKLINRDLLPVEVGGAQDKYQIINVVPSLDTGVCAEQIRNFNQKAALLPNVRVFCVSMDLPFAQKRFCSTEGIENVVAVSDFVKKAFGKTYGLLLEDSPLEGLLTRAVIIIDTEGKIIYQEICPEITKEPNYEAAFFALTKATN